MGLGGCVGGWGWEESGLKLISAEVEAEALLCLAELGNNIEKELPNLETD